MSAQVADRLLSAEAFLEWESAQPNKHELIDNRVYDMTGASRAHNLISVKLATALDTRLSGKGCEIYTSDMRVQVDPVASFTYPDVVVVCGEPRFRGDLAQDTLENPTLLFEILSPSTELIDRNRNLQQYLQLESLQGYFLVAQDKPLIEAYLLHGNDWLYREYAGADSTMVVESLGCRIPLRELYPEMRTESS